MKFHICVAIEKSMADVDFRTDLTTVAPPVGRFSFRQGVPCLLIISKTAQRIMMKFGTEVYGGVALAPV